MFISNWQNAWLLQGELADKPKSSQSSAALCHLVKDASYWKSEHLCRKPAETSLGGRDPGTPDRSGMQPQKCEPSAHSTLIVYPLWERVHFYLTGACLLQQWVMKFSTPATVWKMITACRKEGRKIFFGKVMLQWRNPVFYAFRWCRPNDEAHHHYHDNGTTKHCHKCRIIALVTVSLVEPIGCYKTWVFSRECLIQILLEKQKEAQYWRFSHNSIPGILGSSNSLL